MAAKSRSARPRVALIYVCSDRERHEGQLREIQQFAARADLPVAGVFCDDIDLVNTAAIERPGFEDLLEKRLRLAEIERLDVVVIAHSLSLVVRTSYELCELTSAPEKRRKGSVPFFKEPVRLGLSLMTVREDFDGTTPAGRFARAAFVVMEQFRREVDEERAANNLHPHLPTDSH